MPVRTARLKALRQKYIQETSTPPGTGSTRQTAKQSEQAVHAHACVTAVVQTTLDPRDRHLGIEVDGPPPQAKGFRSSDVQVNHHT